MLPDPHAVDVPLWPPLAAAAAPRLVRLAVPLANADPWAIGQALAAVAAPVGLPVAHWHDDAGGLTWCAMGRLVARRLDAADRFGAAARTGLPQEQDTIALGPALLHEAPRAAWAQAFEDGPCGRPGPFCGLGGGEVLVPSCWLLRRHGDRGACWALVQVWQTPGASQAAVRARLMAMAQACRNAASQVAAAEAQGFVPGSDAAAAPLLPAEEPGVAAAFVRRVAAATAALQHQGLDKVVLARARTLPWRIDADATLAALRAQQQHCVIFALAPAQGGHWLGATPEILLRLQAGEVHTHALAGTAGRHVDAQADVAAGAGLLASAKDLHEHALVVQGLCATLAGLCAPLAPPVAPALLGLRTLWHLHTPIAAVARPEVDALDLAAALHPSPALGGAPTRAALAYLRAHEPWRRGLYAAPLGWTGGAQDGVFVVAIRSLWLSGATVTLFSGAGIVAASDAEAEWRETVLKQAAVAAALRPMPR